MAKRETTTRPPLVLIANSQEWSARSLESILGPNGYAVLRAYTGKQAIERAESAQPDLVILDANLPDADGMAVCQSLRTEAALNASTPILVTTSSHPTRQQRLAALRAGAWEFLGHPIDAEELVLKLDAYVKAKFDADRAREESLLDHITGLYNVRGLARRAREIGSDAFRHHEALACVVFAPDVSPDDREVEGAVRRLAQVLKRAGRVSDAIGRLGQTEFAIIAPATDAVGAVKLAERLAREIESTAAAEAVPEAKTRAGYYAVTDFREAAIEPVDMLVRATTALRMSKAEGVEERIRSFESRPTTS
jgi:diguanylate cyclase (GGDEF)-like protein